MFERGVRAVKAGRSAQAQALLAPLATQDSLRKHPVFGAATTWIGRAFAQRGDTAAARHMWLQGVRRAQRAGRTAAGAADAFLQSMSPDEVRRSPAQTTFAFRHVLKAFGSPVSAREDTVLRRHAAQLAVIVPDSLTETLSRYAEGGMSCAELSVGSTLRRWFQAQDPILSSEQNERIHEHVTRVRTAEARYSGPGRPSGLDARGELYVRLGAPERIVSVTYTENQPAHFPKTKGMVSVSRREISTALRGMGLSTTSFLRKNEVWDYPEVGPAAQFVFIKDRSRTNVYREGTIREILPTRLRMTPKRMRGVGGGSSGGGQQSGDSQSGSGGSNASLPDGSFAFKDVPEWKAYYSVYRSIYEQLRMVGYRYARRYDRIMSFNTVRPSSPQPVTFLKGEMTKNESENYRIRQQRTEQVPKQRSDVMPPAPSAPVAIRTARFLTEAGSLRVEVYWSGEASEWRLSEKRVQSLLQNGHTLSGRHQVRTTAVLRSAEQARVDQTHHTDTLSQRTSSGSGQLQPRFLALRGAATQHRVSIEWIQNVLGESGSTGPLVHVTRTETEFQSALSSDPSKLEMSDLRFLSVPEGKPPVPKSPDALRQRVIPFDQVRADRRLALNFELYHLLFNENDRTRYTVEYSVRHEAEADGLPGLFGGTEAQTTSTETTYEGTSRRTDEHILLELGKVQPDSPTPVTVTVRVTDEMSGQTVERNVSFTLVPAEDT